MNFIVELFLLVLIIAFIFFISKMNKDPGYEYEEDTDEDGNTIEKVIDLKDKE